MTARPPRARRAASQRPTAALLVTVLLAVLAIAVGPAGRVDTQASTTAGQVAGTRVRVHNPAQQAVVAASGDVLAGQGRAATTPAAKEVVGSRVAPRAITSGGGGGTTQLFRHVGPDELADIRATGRFNLGRHSTGKYFAETPEHASEWGAWLNKGQGTVVETRVPTSLAEQLMRWEKLDNIGPARFVSPEQLDWLNQVMNGIREVP